MHERDSDFSSPHSIKDIVLSAMSSYNTGKTTLFPKEYFRGGKTSLVLKNASQEKI